MPTQVFSVFVVVKLSKKAINNNSSMTYQTDEKHLTSLIEYFVGGVSIALNHLKHRFLLHVINR
jgi:hypothetical protein